MIFAVFDLPPLTPCINCSLFYILLIIIIITVIKTTSVSVTVTEVVSVTGWPMHRKQT